MAWTLPTGLDDGPAARGDLGAVSASGSGAFGSGPPFADATITLSQTGGTYGFARLEAHGADPGNFQLVSIEGEVLPGGPYDLDDPAIADLLAIGWEGASTTFKLNVTGGLPLATYTASLDIIDAFGTTVETVALSVTITDAFLAIAQGLGAISLYSPTNIALGALAPTEVSFSDMIGVGADAKIGALATGLWATAVVATPLTPNSLAKMVWNAPGNYGTDGSEYVRGLLPAPGAFGTWFFVVRSPQWASDGWNALVYVNSVTQWLYYQNRYGPDNGLVIKSPATASPKGAYKNGAIQTAVVVRSADDYYTFAITQDAARNTKIYFAPVGELTYPSPAEGIATEAFGGAAIAFAHNATAVNMKGAGVVAAVGFDYVLSAAQLETLHHAVT